MADGKLIEKVNDTDLQYAGINWQNGQATPLNAENLNSVDNAIKQNQQYLNRAIDKINELHRDKWSSAEHTAYKATVDSTLQDHTSKITTLTSDVTEAKKTLSTTTNAVTVNTQNINELKTKTQSLETSKASQSDVATVSDALNAHISTGHALATDSSSGFMSAAEHTAIGTLQSEVKALATKVEEIPTSVVKVINNLNSDSTTDALAAKQGKALNASITSLKSEISNLKLNSGSGDMLKSTYDADGDGKVDSAKTADTATRATSSANSDCLNGHADDYFATATALAELKQTLNNLDGVKLTWNDF